MLAVFDTAFVSGRDRVFADDRAVDAHRRSFTAAGISQHFRCGLVCLGLSLVDAGRAVRRVQLVDPLSVVATVHASIIWICHIGLSWFWISVFAVEITVCSSLRNRYSSTNQYGH